MIDQKQDVHLVTLVNLKMEPKDPASSMGVPKKSTTFTKACSF